MVDLHCHILPRFDDGPANEESALELARALVADGVETVTATPHIRHDHPGVRAEDIEPRCAVLREQLEAEAIPLNVVSGAEVDIDAAMLADAEELHAASYGGRGDYVLVETPYRVLTRNFETLLFRAISARGIGVLLAHPERNPVFQQDVGRLEELVYRGVLVQISASSLLRTDRRSRTRRAVQAMLERRLVHVVATDSHAPPPGRWSSLAGAAEVAARIAPGRATWLVEDAPGAILTGQPIPAMPGAAARRRRFRFH